MAPLPPAEGTEEEDDEEDEAGATRDATREALYVGTSGGEEGMSRQQHGLSGDEHGMTARDYAAVYTVQSSRIQQQHAEEMHARSEGDAWEMYTRRQGQ